MISSFIHRPPRGTVGWLPLPWVLSLSSKTEIRSQECHKRTRFPSLRSWRLSRLAGVLSRPIISHTEGRSKSTQLPIGENCRAPQSALKRPIKQPQPAPNLLSFLGGKILPIESGEEQTPDFTRLEVLGERRHDDFPSRLEHLISHPHTLTTAALRQHLAYQRSHFRSRIIHL